MHRLNQSSDNRRRWCEYQQAELNKFGVADLQIAFPGSLLCNQILVPANREISVNDVGFNLPDVSHVVYEYCDGHDRNALLENSFVVDVDGEIDSDSVAGIVTGFLKDVAVSRVVLLGRAAYLRYGEAIRSNLNHGIEVQVFEPDWISPSAMHSVYRQASAVLFINTMRVLDAVATGCKGCLVADQGFRRELGFPVLQRYLLSKSCEVYDEAGVPALSVEFGTMLSHFVVENSIQALQKALRQNSTVNDLSNHTEEDWFVNLNTEMTLPVIKPYRSLRFEVLYGLRDRKTRVVRKMVKLWNDPGAFFLDSQFRMLRILGRAFQDNTADI